MNTFKISITKMLSIVIAILFFNSPFLFAQNDLKKLGFESAHGKKIVTTKMAGMDIEKKQEFFIAKNGGLMAAYETEKRNISMTNIVEEEKIVIIVDGTWTISYDPVTRKGTKTKIEFASQLAGMSEEDIQNMADQLGQSTGTVTEDIGTKVIAGQTCTGTSATTNMMGMENVTEIWMFKNFIMESITTGTAELVERVTEFILGSNYDPAKLLVPSDVTLEVIESPF